MASEFTYELIEHITTLSSNPETGWTCEVNLVAYNDKKPVYDIRDWNPDHSKMSKGVTLDQAEFETLVHDCKTYLDKRSEEERQAKEKARQLDEIRKKWNALQAKSLEEQLDLACNNESDTISFDEADEDGGAIFYVTSPIAIGDNEVIFARIYTYENCTGWRHISGHVWADIATAKFDNYCQYDLTRYYAGRVDETLVKFEAREDGEHEELRKELNETLKKLVAERRPEVSDTAA